MTNQPKTKRGFATLSAARRSEIASMGGKTAQTNGTAHRFSVEEARAASIKGAAARRAKKLAKKGAVHG